MSKLTLCLFASLSLVGCTVGVVERDIHGPDATSAASIDATTSPPTPGWATTMPSPAALATAVPTSRGPIASASPSPLSKSDQGPQVISFTVTPTATLAVGDEVSLSWKAIGDKAELCIMGAGGPVRCEEVPLAGDRTITFDELTRHNPGLGLRVTVGDSSIWATENLYPQCDETWFFEDAPRRTCPDAAPVVSYAAAEYFQNGFMVWIEALDRFYVFYYKDIGEPGFQTFEESTGLTLRPGASVDHRVGEEPPPGLHEPVSGFGLIWRGETEEWSERPVRQRLGWAIAPEFGFETVRQCATISVCQHAMSHCYVRDPDGEILRLRPASTAKVRQVWEMWSEIDSTTKTTW